MSLDYLVIQEKLETVKSEIEQLINYMQQTDTDDIEVYAKLADISANVLQCDRHFHHIVQSEIDCKK